MHEDIKVRSDTEENYFRELTELLFHLSICIVTAWFNLRRHHKATVKNDLCKYRWHSGEAGISAAAGLSTYGCSTKCETLVCQGLSFFSIFEKLNSKIPDLVIMWYWTLIFLEFKEKMHLTLKKNIYSFQIHVNNISESVSILRCASGQQIWWGKTAFLFL